MKKDNVKKYMVFLLLFLPLAFIVVENKIPDNDIWFLLNNGRYVMQSGIPVIDPFTIHEGLSYVMQQWLSSVLLWKIYDIFGQYGILIFMYMFSVILLFTYYKLCYVTSQNRMISVFITAVTFSLINTFVVTRPQIFTYLILILELWLLELYVKNNNSKYLIGLPILSLLLINLHASMWFFLCIFMLPYLINTISIKKVTIDKIKLKPLIIIMFLMLLVGFINPYGVDAITYIFKSYGIVEINNSIAEMKALTINDLYFKIVVGILFILILFNYLRKDVKLDIRHCLFVCGMTILAFSHKKCFALFCIVLGFVFSYYFKKISKRNRLINSDIFKAVFRGLLTGLTLVSLVTVIAGIKYSIISYNDDNFYLSTGITEITDYMLDNVSIDDVVLFVEYNDGGFTEFLGFKSYMDPRAELFFKKYNNKEDIYLESLEIESDPYYDYDLFINKYNFTHLIVKTDTYLDKYLSNDSNYEIVFNQYFNPDTKDVVIKKLYERKDYNKQKHT